MAAQPLVRAQLAEGPKHGELVKRAAAEAEISEHNLIAAAERLKSGFSAGSGFCRGEGSGSPVCYSACAILDTIDNPDSAFVFATERGGPFTPDAINRLIKRIGERARLGFPIHAHMLRHACGYALANAGHDTRRIQDWLGHRSIQHTTRYTQLSAAPFKDFWR
jgi:hypothetical protein